MADKIRNEAIDASIHRRSTDVLDEHIALLIEFAHISNEVRTDQKHTSTEIVALYPLYATRPDVLFALEHAIELTTEVTA